MIQKIIKAVIFLSAIVLLFFTTWFSFEFYVAPKTISKKISFDVKKGEGAKIIAQNLKDQGIIKKKWPFLFGYKIFFSSKSLKAGEYIFQLPLSTKDALSILTEGKVYLHPITIPEGLTRREIAQHLESLNFANEEDFISASSQTDDIASLDEEAINLEGYLFPETYHLPKGTSEEKIISTMISQFEATFHEKWRKRAAEIGMTIRKVVILASMIEKEASLSEEKKLVSATFHNRLRIGMKLDCDPTIIYALKEEGRFQDRLRTKDLKYNTPYNTYLYSGLPPGPICNPGKGSLEAALYPAEEDYLYFVSKNDGSHHFSSTFKEHQRAVQKYQKNK